MVEPPWEEKGPKNKMFLPIMSQPGQTMAILQARQTSDEKDIQETKFNSIDHLRAALSRFCINLLGKLSPAGQSP